VRLAEAISKIKFAEISLHKVNYKKFISYEYQAIIKHKQKRDKSNYKIPLQKAIHFAL